MFDGLFNVIEQSSHVHVAPGRVAAQRACTPDAQAATGERANAVDPNWIERVLLAFGDLRDRFHCPAYHLVSRGLMYTPLIVIAGIDARHVP